MPTIYVGSLSKIIKPPVGVRAEALSPAGGFLHETMLHTAVSERDLSFCTYESKEGLLFLLKQTNIYRTFIFRTNIYRTAVYKKFVRC